MKNDCPEYYTLKLYPDGVMEQVIECSDVIRALIKENNVTGFDAYLYGNIIKYLWRYGRKGQRAGDLEKAKNYLAELEFEEVIKEVCEDE